MFVEIIWDSWILLENANISPRVGRRLFTLGEREYTVGKLLLSWVQDLVLIFQVGKLPRDSCWVLSYVRLKCYLYGFSKINSEPWPWRRLLIGWPEWVVFELFEKRIWLVKKSDIWANPVVNGVSWATCPYKIPCAFHLAVDTTSFKVDGSKSEIRRKLILFKMATSRGNNCSGYTNPLSQKDISTPHGAGSRHLSRDDVKAMGRGKILEIMAQGAACYKHNIKNRTVPHCKNCCKYELWSPQPGQVITCTGDQFID